MSEELHEFYKAYLAWATAAVVENGVLDKGFGLCLCFTQWAESMGASYPDYFPFLEEMRKQFMQADLDPNYPFGSVDGFVKDTENNQCHLNPKRVKWAKEHMS